MSTERAVFQIDELDCADEVLQLRSALKGHVGIVELDFDVLNGRMVARYDAERTSPNAILDAITRVGMHGRLGSGEQQDEPAGWWRQRGRLVMAVLAGGLLVAGFLTHLAITGDFVAAFDFAKEGSEHAVPLVARFLYGLSIVCGAWFVAPRAWASLRHRRADMNLLMCVAACGAILLGQWLEAAVVTFLFAVSLLLEHWSMGRARRAISRLMDASPERARCVRPDGTVQEVDANQVSPGELLIVRPSERFPLDGVVREGTSMVNQAPITGESNPVAKQPGDEVFAGTINEDGALRVEVTRHADDTTLARIIRMVEQAQASRAPAEQWVEKFARYYTPAMMILALIVAIAPPILLSASWNMWIYNALVLLVIACPCALVISTPVTIVSALTAAARAGVLVKGGRYLEAAAGLRAVAVDKTGTLTLGKPTVQEIIPFTGHSRDEVLQRAASMETHSTHPIARAILRCARQEEIEPQPVEAYRVLSGQGAEAMIDGRAFWIGSHRLWTARAADAGQAAEVAERLQRAGNSVVAVGNDDHVCGLIGIADQVRPGARKAIESLHALGVRPVEMLTGDNEPAARAVASSTGIDAHRAELLPEDKVRAVEDLRKRYGQVAMVGDGVNDAPAMAVATVGIAMGAIGTDAAIETADVALMSDELARLPWLVAHGRRAVRVIKQNIAFALGLKLLFIALALTGLASLWMAIAADTGASLLVIFNGMRLLKA